MSDKHVSKSHLSFEQVKEDIKQRADLANIVSRHTKLVKSSTGFKACCPLPGHKEKTPSFNVNTRENFFYCYGCNRGGDVFKFLELVEGMPFNEALKELSQSLGIELPTQKNFKAVNPEKKNYQLAGYDLLLRTSQFYHRILKDRLSDGAKDAYFYLETRGIGPELMELYGLGWALEGRHGLSSKIKDKQEKEVALDLGLIRDYRGQSQDMFVGRLMIPIKDLRGRVVAFSGRTLQEVGPDNPKYKNSKESEWFKKKETLYGLFESLSLIRDQGFVCIVEGYFDQWAFHRRNIPAVAVMGTALGEAHLDILGRFTKQVILVLDTDRAGVESTKRSLPLLLEKGFDVRVFSDLNGKDPDEWLAQVSNLESELTVQKLKSAPEALEWWAKKVLQEGQSAQMTRLQLLKSLGPIWHLAKSQAHKVLLADEVGRVLGLAPSDMRTSLDELTKNSGSNATQKRVENRNFFPATEKTGLKSAPPSPPTKIEKATEELLVFSFSYWDEIRPLGEENWEKWERIFVDTRGAQFVQQLAARTQRDGESLGKEELRHLLVDESIDALVKRALFRALGSDPKKDLEKAKITKAWSELALNLLREKQQIERQQLLGQLRTLAPESPEATNLLNRIQGLRLDLEKSK